MRQKRWIELFSDYECEIRFHPGKANVMADALSKKEWSEAFIQENILVERLHGLDQQMQRKEDKSLYFIDRIWVPLVGYVRMVVLNEAHKSRYSVNPRADKMYHDLRDMYWWTGMKRDSVVYVSKCLTCAKVKAEHQRPSGLLQQPEIPEWKWGKLTMDLITKLPRSRSGHDAIWVLLKVSPWKGVMLFGKKGKLAPRYVGPFKILERIDLVAYRLRLPEELHSTHDTFHVSNLKKCLADVNLHVPLDDIKVNKTLHFVEEPVKILDREIKKLKRRKIALVKVRWNSKRGPEFT
uniref:Putative reverse transcriptase domain-containing protein n=1 Tax=Tanacetum cinerariifolium TaxID=118510 RepID=A0A6L2LD59_TANCI|nr:putative reverse transcriptase domain-containing protein [Tanacetum cinerariifolium]